MTIAGRDDNHIEMPVPVTGLSTMRTSLTLANNRAVEIPAHTAWELQNNSEAVIQWDLAADTTVPAEFNDRLPGGAQHSEQAGQAGYYLHIKSTGEATDTITIRIFTSERGIVG